jgi:hypothetical protein
MAKLYTLDDLPKNAEHLKKLLQEYGAATAQRHWEEDQGTGASVDRAVRQQVDAEDELVRYLRRRFGVTKKRTSKSDAIEEECEGLARSRREQDL